MANLLKKAGKWILTWFPIAWYKICREQICYVLALVTSIGVFIVWEAFYQDGSVLGEYKRAVQIFMSAEYVRIWSLAIMASFCILNIIQRNWGRLTAVLLAIAGIQARVYFYCADIWQSLASMFVVSLVYVTVLNCLEAIVNQRGSSILHPKEMPEIKYNTIRFRECRREEDMKERKGTEKSGETK